MTLDQVSRLVNGCCVFLYTVACGGGGWIIFARLSPDYVVPSFAVPLAIALIVPTFFAMFAPLWAMRRYQKKWPDHDLSYLKNRHRNASASIVMVNLVIVAFDIWRQFG